MKKLMLLLILMMSFWLNVLSPANALNSEEKPYADGVPIEQYNALIDDYNLLVIQEAECAARLEQTNNLLRQQKAINAETLKEVDKMQSESKKEKRKSFFTGLGIGTASGTVITVLVILAIAL